MVAAKKHVPIVKKRTSPRNFQELSGASNIGKNLEAELDLMRSEVADSDANRPKALQSPPERELQMRGPKLEEA